MRTLTLCAMLLAAAAPLAAQGHQHDDPDHPATGGGTLPAGWHARPDRADANLNGLVFAPMGGGFHVVTGPAVTYWNPANKAAGNYTVKATFAEPKFQGLNSHPHPYGIMIGGNDLDTPTMSALYCSAYGNGTFIVRGFGPAPFPVNGARAEANAAVKKVAPGEAVTQEIALSVKGDKIECAVNGTVVGSYDKAAVVAAGKLKSTDGVYGLRFGHNTEAMVTNFAMSKN